MLGYEHMTDDGANDGVAVGALSGASGGGWGGEGGRQQDVAASASVASSDAAINQDCLLSQLVLALIRMASTDPRSRVLCWSWVCGFRSRVTVFRSRDRSEH